MYGDETASEIMDTYLKEVIGLFNPKAKVIYVGSFMEPCRQESIIAHELTHYFQVMENGTPSIGSYQGDTLRYSQEMKAGKIENQFRETFCTSPDN
jgi:Zn-dependent peptidase ImmA (M78 family)